MSARAGVVYLVGAGPGDPGLVTVKALELVASADVVLHDRLIPASVLDGAESFIPPDDTLNNMLVLDEMRRQIGTL